VRTKAALWTAIALAAIGGLFFAGIATAAPARTTVSIQPEQTGFSGFVSSSRASCANGRRVHLYRQVGRRWRHAGSDIAQPNGPRFQWAIQVPQPGRYYAAVKATRSCRAARSRVASPQPAPVNLIAPAPRG
jgi:hypothetical protein